ncbi:hypothetical protein DFA_00958 [Cavenderia fasciculata]|uniref:DUF2828 family protein n=1 Tax=Cavenderia fasciculata TaxID=261658 RepID=F4PUR4_CACFS|nr:uncharacterized protein DFA_00958 [Cavenderia fasciculata]EGG21083.1 hypothetical protein DFA_00958 [Cavenderia fasciculata]|eukprot:XP_004358933.1 hypothetical protein DFA_00958 [Cavenderia fasciculata]
MSTQTSKAAIIKKYLKAKKTKTAKGAVAYTTTGDARVDLFYHTARGINREQLREMLTASWAKSPLDTLKIIFYNRDCRGGKGEREIFHHSIVWLHEQSPESVAKNFKLIPHFGSWKDVTSLIGTGLEPKALEVMAAQLQEDAKNMADGKTVSLCAKWAPSEHKANDTASKAAKKLAVLLAVNRTNAKKEYRKQYLSPLRKHLAIVERNMSQNEWDKIEYSKVPSRAMKLSRKAFERHDEAGFKKYQESLVKGETKVNAKQLFPHEIVQEFISRQEDDVILEEQWKVLEAETAKLGSLADCIVLSDVSGSMSGTPMQVSVALGLLISRLTAAPFKDIVITFHETPSFHHVQGNSLKERVADLLASPWGGSTNFNAVFKMILETAQKNNLPAEAMPKKLFVISDMQFDAADNKFKSNHQNMIDQYKKAGYPVPQMIYWNVNGAYTTTPVGSASTPGVGLVSGFSPSILKAIIQNGNTDSLSPLALLQPVLDDARYADLLV